MLDNKRASNLSKQVQIWFDTEEYQINIPEANTPEEVLFCIQTCKQSHGERMSYFLTSEMYAKVNSEKPSETGIPPHRMKEIIRRENDPGQLIARKGENNIVHCYRKDVGELISYIRQLELKLGIKSTKLY